MKENDVENTDDVSYKFADLGDRISQVKTIKIIADEMFEICLIILFLDPSTRRSDQPKGDYLEIKTNRLFRYRKDLQVMATLQSSLATQQGLYL